MDAHIKAHALRLATIQREAFTEIEEAVRDGQGGLRRVRLILARAKASEALETIRYRAVHGQTCG